MDRFYVWLAAWVIFAYMLYVVMTTQVEEKDNFYDPYKILGLPHVRSNSPCYWPISLTIFL